MASLLHALSSSICQLDAKDPKALGNRIIIRWKEPGPLNHSLEDCQSIRSTSVGQVRKNKPLLCFKLLFGVLIVSSASVTLTNIHM